MRILYVFPHPDDESFGPALAISRQRREGDEVHLLTLTRGGATKQRHRLGLSIEEMGEVRLKEMEEVQGVLNLSGMSVLDHPDSGLKEVDPRTLEESVASAIHRVEPAVVVTYAVHGVSGFHDHLVTHAVVKRVFCEERERLPSRLLRRLALFTLPPTEEPDSSFPLHTSTNEEIDCAVEVEDRDVDRARRALDCYVTYRDVIEAADPLSRVGRTVHFELFQESRSPWLTSLGAGL